MRPLRPRASLEGRSGDRDRVVVRRVLSVADLRPLRVRQRGQLMKLPFLDLRQFWADSILCD